VIAVANRTVLVADRDSDTRKIFTRIVWRNSHTSKTKTAADLAAIYLVDFKVLLAPQVGLEPTTLRLTAEYSAIELLRIA
jgi:hypothetical protein